VKYWAPNVDVVAVAAIGDALAGQNPVVLTEIERREALFGNRVSAAASVYDDLSKGRWAL
jgi:hypothetical protein